MHGTISIEDFASRQGAMLTRLAELVGHESPSGERAALDALARTLAARLEVLGAEVDLIANPEGGDHVRRAGPLRGGPTTRARRWFSGTSTPSGRTGRSPNSPSGSKMVAPSGRASST